MVRAWLAALIAASTGCAAILGGEAGILDEGTTGTEAGADVTSPVEAGDDVVAPTDAPSNEDADAPVDSGVTCPDAGGGPMVVVGSHCIDAYEVTVAQYTQFLASGPNAAGQIALCGWNNSFQPAGFVASATDFRPVVNVDWCDAYAFCKWAGKRLCGAVDGGAVPTASATVAAEDQWFNACSHSGDGQHIYPYGNTFDASTCNWDGDAGPLLEAGTKTGCVGGYPGVFDMSGNVREWEDSCTSTADAAFDNCNRRGGGADDPASRQTCLYVDPQVRSYTSGHTGFRCCGP